MTIDVASRKRELLQRVRSRVQRGVPEGNLDLAHLKSIHQHIFDGVYSDAGETRKEPGSFKGHPSVPAEGLEKALQKRLRRLRDAGYLEGTRNKDELINEVADLYVDLNGAAPFRMGGTLATSLFIRGVALRLGVDVDLTHVNQAQLDFAISQALAGRKDGIRDLISQSATTADWVNTAPPSVAGPQAGADDIRAEPMLAARHGAFQSDDARTAAITLAAMVKVILSEIGADDAPKKDKQALFESLKADAAQLVKYPDVLRERIILLAEDAKMVRKKNVAPKYDGGIEFTLGHPKI
ncbi:Fic family protein [Alcanivorax sp. 1008]|uniref:Fic family protein n=1 Tax=Alcanivorax sp. 1008 TaxID=2816853 RepID=UPI001DE14D7E|nr:Fic family protein [Alcanivorax sp. 1008]MCC1496748.1 Fic family protein [Alcanivorax sp. 1008]